MSDDRTLLERAAKAAGYTIADWAGAVPMVLKPGRTIAVEWQPLSDDGDAFRLAVALRLDVLHYIERDGLWPAHVQAVGRRAAASEQINSDPAAATRRAIVRAAASLAE